MNVSRQSTAVWIIRAAAAAAGVGLFFAARRLERGASLLASSLLEEGVKGGLFLGLWLARRYGGGRLKAIPAAEFLPLICITGFALAENILYFLQAPTGSIYQRLLYSYPLHLNTAALYTLAYLAGRPLAAALAGLAGLAYHFALNVLSLSALPPTVYAMGALNLVALAVLFLHIHRLRLERSLDSCWIPD